MPWQSVRKGQKGGGLVKRALYSAGALFLCAGSLQGSFLPCQTDDEGVQEYLWVSTHPGVTNWEAEARSWMQEAEEVEKEAGPGGNGWVRVHLERALECAAQTQNDALKNTIHALLAGCKED